MSRRVTATRRSSMANTILKRRSGDLLRPDIKRRCFWAARKAVGAGLAATQGSSTIRRLDGSHISTADAESFARETLAAAHVTGAQIAVLDQGRLVWSAAFGLRRRDPVLPMNTETTTWAASITKSVFATY